MKSLVAHILRKDFRHLWPWLALWWGLFALMGLYPTWAFHRLMHSGEYYLDDPAPLVIAGVAWFVVLLVIIAQLVESDSPTNDRALWRSWPLPTAQLLLAKLLFLLGFVLAATALLKIVTLACYHFSWEQAQVRLWDDIIILALCVVYPLLAAVLFRRPMVGYIVLIVILVSASYFASRYVESHAVTSVAPPAARLIFSLYLVSALAAIALVYSKQRRLLAILVLLACLFFSSIIGQLAPAGRSAHPSVSLSLALPDFAFNLSIHDLLYDSDSSSGFPFILRSTFTEHDLPSHTAEILYPIKSDWTLSWPDQPSLTGSRKFDLPTPTIVAGQAVGLPFHFASAVQAFGIKRLLNPTSTGYAALALFSQKQVDQIRHTPAKFETRFSFVVGRLEESVLLPLTRGSVFREGPNTTGIISFERDPGTTQAILTVAEQSPPRDYTRWYNNTEFDLLVNRRLGEAILGGQTQVNMDNISVLELSRVSYAFDFQSRTGDGQTHDMTNDEIRAWLADAQFLRLRLVPVGTQVGLVTVDPLIVGK